MRILYSIAIGVYLVIGACFLFACNPVKKAIKTMDEHPAQAALFCASRFPAKDSLIKGDTVTVRDTITSKETEIVTVDCPPNQKDTVRISKACPPGKTIYVTNTIRDTIVRVDKAKEKVLENNLTACQTTVTKVQGDYEDMKDKRDKWRLWFWIMVGAAGVYVVLKVKKILPF